MQKCWKLKEITRNGKPKVAENPKRQELDWQKDQWKVKNIWSKWTIKLEEPKKLKNYPFKDKVTVHGKYEDASRWTGQVDIGNIWYNENCPVRSW